MHTSYDPYKYPPDYQLAKIHQKASQPGKKTYLQYHSYDIQKPDTCPCCQKPLLKPYPQGNWRRRGIPEDFHEYGGAIVTYFWLMRLYAFIFGLVFVVYSAYLLVCIYQFCDLEHCQKFLGFWVISNENLFSLLQQKEENDVIIRISLLRGFAYIILVVGNTMSLYVVSRFKKRFASKKGIQNFTLIFKNVGLKQFQNDKNSEESIISQNGLKSQEQTIRELIYSQIPQCKIIEIVPLKQLQPYYSIFNNKIKIYYELLQITEQQRNENPKIKKHYDKLTKQLNHYHLQTKKYIDKYQIPSDRVIVTMGSQQNVQRILSKYHMRGFRKFMYLLGIQTQKNKIYAERCPLPQQIIWNYIGHHQVQKIKLKVISFLLFIGLLAICYGILSFSFKIIYVYQIPSPFGGILSFISLFLIVVLALSFRQLMNRLSEMRYPNTQTSRTMFIVITTVLFHYIFYLALPTFYFWQAQSHEKNKNLLIVTNQTITFIVFQVILASLNVMHLVWKKKQPRVENQQKPIGCQKILHQQIQYPHFPIQFKLIAIFKIFSFITFFAFQAPAILFLTFFLLVFLYYRDKYAIYFHFKKQIIDSTVQFRFLKFYAWFFVIFSYIIFLITQNLEVEFWIGFIVAVACIIAIFFIRQPKPIEDSFDKIDNIEKLKLDDSYKKRYDKFLSEAVNQDLQRQISQYVSSYISVQNQEGNLQQNLV